MKCVYLWTSLSSFVNTSGPWTIHEIAFAEGFLAALRGIRVDKRVTKAKGANYTHKKLSSPPSTAALEEFSCRPFGPQSSESPSLKNLSSFVVFNCRWSKQKVL